MGWAREHCRGDQGRGGVVRIHRSACLWGSSWLPCRVNDRVQDRPALDPTRLGSFSLWLHSGEDHAAISTPTTSKGRRPQEGSAMEGGPQEDGGGAPPQAQNPCLEHSAQQSPGSFCRISLPSWGVALTLTSKMASYIGYLCQEEVRRMSFLIK